MCCVCADHGDEELFSRGQKKVSRLRCQFSGYARNKPVDVIVARHPRFSLDRADTRRFQFSLRSLLIRVDRWMQFFLDWFGGSHLPITA
jgi:hypothetical protein